jgi:DNA topoisomerase-2
MSNLTDDMHGMFMKRVDDACAVTDNDITIYLNEVKLDFKNFEKYVDLYIGSKSEHTRVYEQVNERWEVIASYNDFNGFDQVSFVNGIWTLRGGKHVEYILNQIVKRLSEMIAKKNKNANIKPQNIKDNLILFVKSTIINPTFDSQSKETLTTPFSKFGSKAELSDKFIEKLYKTGIADKIMEICEMNNHKDLAKTDGKKRSVIKGIPKLDDANWAGTAKSKECTLILTEGDSAKTMVVAGLSQVGRDKYGVFPLKGKLMNVKDTSVKKIMDNEEITNLKKIIGLETNKKYTSVDDLRYGKIMLLCDSDVDGSHIKALAFNLFHTLWPSLFEMDNFLVYVDPYCQSHS